MLNLSNCLTEAENASITYPDLYKPKDIWKIREDNDPSGYYGYTVNGYLTASFVLEKNLKWPDLGFNLSVQPMNGGRTLLFLTKEDAEDFLRLANSKYPGLQSGLVVAKGRGGVNIVRVNTKTTIPIYIQKHAIEYLSGFPDTKVPEEIRKRLEGPLEVEKTQKEKEDKNALDQQKGHDFNVVLRKAVEEIDPQVKVITGPTLFLDFNYNGAKISLTSTRGALAGTKRAKIDKIIFPNIDWDGVRPALQKTLVPDEEQEDRLNYKNACQIQDSHGMYSPSIYYPSITLRQNWDSDRMKKEITTYIDKISDTINSFFNVEEFI